MKYSREAFVECLVEHEGYRKNVYKDTLGIDTIGIGRNLEDRGITKEELDYLDYPNIETVYERGIEYADAVYLACNDIEIVEEELLRHQPCVSDLSATRQMVLMDMAFNMGVPRLLKFKRCGRRYTKGTSTQPHGRCWIRDGRCKWEQDRKGGSPHANRGRKWQGS